MLLGADKTSHNLKRYVQVNDRCEFMQQICFELLSRYSVQECVGEGGRQ